jgi:uroporphyrinogen III methyltransferase/synthase
MRRLELLGAVPYLLPTVEVREPPDWEPVDRALSELNRYAWVVFTSSNGVHALIRRLHQTGHDLRALGPVQLAVIGPSTAEALRQYHLEPDLMPAVYNSEALAAALTAKAAGQRILLARADRGRDALRQQLSQVASVEQVAVYSQVDILEADAAVLDALRGGAIRFVILTSSNIARALAQLVDGATHERIRSGMILLVSISPVTSQDIRAVGWPVAVEATEATVESALSALCHMAQTARPTG